jgi:hypothetical protein
VTVKFSGYGFSAGGIIQGGIAMMHVPADVVPQGRSMASRVASASLVVLGAGVWLGLFALMLFVVPEFNRIFETFGMSLPALTQVVLRAGIAMGRMGWILVLLWFVVTTGVSIWAAASNSRQAVGRAGTFVLVSILVVFVVGAFLMIALMVPMVALIIQKADLP